jgi:hypothetical protein
MSQLNDPAVYLLQCLEFHARWISSLITSGQSDLTKSGLSNTASDALNLADRLSTTLNARLALDQMSCKELELCAQACISYLEELEILTCIGEVKQRNTPRDHIDAQFDLQALIQRVSLLHKNLERAACAKRLLGSCSESTNPSVGTLRKNALPLTEVP